MAPQVANRFAIRREGGAKRGIGSAYRTALMQNKSLQRYEKDEVLGRGRPSPVFRSLPRGRLLKGTRVSPELSR